MVNMDRNSSTEDISQASSRPASSYTNESAFADSAVQMDSITPIIDNSKAQSNIQTHSTILPQSPESIDQSLSDRVRQLAAVIWTLEQEDCMPATRKEWLQKALAKFENNVSSAENDADTAQMSESQPSDTKNSQVVQQDPHKDNSSSAGNSEEEDEWIDEADLLAVRENLTATVQSMRLRQQEQRHLHELTVRKLEAVAQRCLIQERQIQEMTDSMKELRLENQILGDECDRLRSVTSVLESESARKEVAVEAMSSAVAGLEGWIDSTQASNSTPSKQPKPKRQRVVVRGKGRFRGRYVVDENENTERHHHGEDDGGGPEEFQEGIRAWVRGFRDVEEEFRQHASPIPSRWREALDGQHRFDEDDWGDFESPVR